MRVPGGKAFQRRSPVVCGERSLSLLLLLLSTALPSTVEEITGLQGLGAEGTRGGFGQGRAVGPPCPPACVGGSRARLLPSHRLKHTGIFVEQEGFGVFFQWCGMAAPGEAVPKPGSPPAHPGSRDLAAQGGSGT